MARDMGLIELANKAESYEICFIPDNDYRGFLKRRKPDLEASVKGGQFINQQGAVIGTHEGYPFYTVGQRKGLGKAFGEPMFVTDINPDTNVVTLGREEDLDKNGMWVRNINMQKYASIEGIMEATTKVRYKHEGLQSALQMIDNRVKVEFNGKVSGIAPGQSAVFYEGEDVIGGGHIVSSYNIAK